MRFNVKRASRPATADAASPVQGATAFLKDRLHQVVSASPWLAGTLATVVVDKKKTLVVRFPDAITSVDELVDENGPQLREDMPYSELCKRVIDSSAHIKRGDIIQSKKLWGLCKLTIGETADGGFYTIFSVSHVVSNGACFYMVYNQVFGGADISAIHAKRKPEAQAKVRDVIGAPHYDFMLGAGSMWNGILCLLFGKKPRTTCVLVDKDKLAAAKTAAKAAAPDAGNISTNDILTSTFGTAVKPRLLSMAIELRDRIPDLTFSDGGNYHHALVSRIWCRTPGFLVLVFFVGQRPTPHCDSLGCRRWTRRATRHQAISAKHSQHRHPCRVPNPSRAVGAQQSAPWRPLPTGRA